LTVPAVTAIAIAFQDAGYVFLSEILLGGELRRRYEEES